MARKKNESKDSMTKYASNRGAEVSKLSINTSPVRQKSVEVKRAENGYIVSQWVPGEGMKPGRERLIVCKTSQEAQSKAAALLKV